jgi:hypothetical protein
MSHNHVQNMHHAQYAREHYRCTSRHIGWRIFGATIGVVGVAASLSMGAPQLAGSSLWYVGYSLFGDD